MKDFANEPFVDYQKIVQRTQALITSLRYEYRDDSAVGVVLELLDRKYANIIADETFEQAVRE